MNKIDKQIISCINYLRGHIDLFLEVEELEEDYIHQLKKFVELVFFYNLIPDESKKAYQLSFIEEFINSKLESVNFVKLFKRNINSLSGLATLEEYCIKNNYSRFHDALRFCIYEQKLDLKLERIPFRLLDLKYSLEKANISSNLPSYKELFEKTALGKGLPICYYSKASMYSVTHTIFYITDLGRGNLIAVNKDEFLNLIRVLIGERILSSDLDILGELLLCTYFLGLEEKLTELVKFSIEFLLNSQNSDGSFPAPIVSINSNEYTRFRENYHTTLVSLGVLLWNKKKELLKC